MINLSERLKVIADYINIEEDVADIGTDHGYLPLYLLEKNYKRKVIFADINHGPLEKAKHIIKKEHPEMPINKFDIRKSDGLTSIDPGEVDVVVIAGMGGLLIQDILSKDLKKTFSYKKFILQARTASDKLRKRLDQNDFHIADEELITENGHICEIILAETNGKKNTVFKSELDYLYSPIIINKRTSIVRDWIDESLKKEVNIYKRIKSQGNDESQRKLEDVEKKINKLHQIKDEF